MNYFGIVPDFGMRRITPLAACVFLATTRGAHSAQAPGLEQSPMLLLALIALSALACLLAVASLLGRERRTAAVLRGQLEEAGARGAELQQSFQSIVSRAPDAIITISSEGFIESFNPAAERMFGWSEAELRDRHFHEIFPLDDDAETHLHELVHNASSELLGLAVEISARRRNGESFRAECSSAELSRNGQRGILAIVRDVTAVRAHERRLLESELRLREAQELARLGNLELDLADGRMFWSDELFQLFGLQPRSPAPEIRQFLLLIHPEDRDGLETALDALIRSGSLHEQSYRLLPTQARQAWHCIRLSVDRDDTGRPLRLLGTVQDITAQHELEEQRRRVEDKLGQIRKLETIGAVSSAIAHDFNNILTPIIGFTDLSIEELGGQSLVQRHLEQVRRGASRARELVRRILSFSDSTQHELQVVTLRPIVDEVLGLLSIRAGRRIELVASEEGGPLHVLADATHIHQVLLNLCTNALQAIGRESGRIEVRLRKLNVDLGMLERLPSLGLGPHALISVSDSGSGIREQDLGQIFEPFFSSRAEEPGSGIGLSVVHGIVLSLGGEIEVSSTPGRGSTFSIYLPLSRSVPKPDPAQPGLLPTGRERILFVDDEPDINSLVLQMLEKLGYRVSTCKSPSAALDLLREQPEQFDLLITDLTMPRMDGLHLVRSLRELGLELPVILITGYSEGLAGDIINELGIARVVHKPLIRSELAEAIREALGIAKVQARNDKNPVGR